MATTGITPQQNGSETSPIKIPWPNNGGCIRIWSVMSKKNDGCWQIKDQRSEDNDTFVLDGKGTDDHRSLFHYYPATNPDHKDQQGSIDTDDGEACWLGIPGDKLGGKAKKDKIYMLRWTDDNKIVEAKGYDKSPELRSSITAPPELRSSITAPPDPSPAVVPTEKEQTSLTFRMQYKHSKGVFLFRDYYRDKEGNTDKHHYVRTDGKGKVSRHQSTTVQIPDGWTPCFNDPGFLYNVDSYGECKVPTYQLKKN